MVVKIKVDEGRGWRCKSEVVEEVVKSEGVSLAVLKESRRK